MKMINSTSMTSTSGVTLMSASGPLLPALLNAVCRSLQPGRSPKADVTTTVTRCGRGFYGFIQLSLPTPGVHAMRN
nr:hypothetical protein [Stenotrophomonas pavanii]